MQMISGFGLNPFITAAARPPHFQANQLARVAKAINDNFSLSTLREYTVEAGRPDTVTSEKLAALKSAGVGRISINPQSFNDDVLAAIAGGTPCAKRLMLSRLHARRDLII